MYNCMPKEDLKKYLKGLGLYHENNEEHSTCCGFGSTKGIMFFPSLIDRMHTARSTKRLCAEGGFYWLSYVLLWLLAAWIYSGFQPLSRAVSEGCAPPPLPARRSNPRTRHLC